MDEKSGPSERITYLIANYNLGAYVADCLQSLRAQTRGEWLALVVDDGSTDRSVEIIASIADDRIRLLRNERNVGYIATLTRLIAEARTDIVAILDADDALAPNATEQLVRAYAENPDTGFVYSRFARYDAALTTRRGTHGGSIPKGGSALRDGGVGAIRSFRRSVYARTAGLDETMLYAEDRDLVYKLEEVTRPVFVDAVLYHYRETPQSQSRDPWKRALGARNTWRARRQALRRRGLAGSARVAHEILFLGDYVAYRWQRPVLVHALARALAVGTRLASRALEGRLREPYSVTTRG